MRRYKVTTIYRITQEVDAYDEQDAFDRAAELGEIELDIDADSRVEMDDYWIEEIG